VLIRLTSPGLQALTNRRRADSTERALRSGPAPPTTGGGMGRDRVPAGWYLAPGADPPPSRGGPAPGDEAIPVKTIRWWTAGAGAFAVLAVVAWVTDNPALGVVLIVVAVVVLGVSLNERRRNRWLDQATTWNTGHHHEFPPTGKDG
jgi:Flp pilus assembly protein TadB